MKCEDALRAISAAADGELDEGDELHAQLDDHLEQCAGCARFERNVVFVRSQLRFEPIAEVPDVVAGVMANLPARPPNQRALRWQLQSRRRAIALAAAIVALVVGATVAGVGPGQNAPRPAAADDLQDQVLTAQHEIASVDAEFKLTEHGRSDQPDSGGRRDFSGELAYRAPETLSLSLSELHPATEPAAGDLRLVVKDDTWSLHAARSCSSCPGGVSDWSHSVINREPFSDTAPTPLELITAVDSFALTADPTQLGERTIAERSALGVRVQASQVARFLDALSPAGDLRAVYPSDPVDVWLDRDDLVPLAVEVRAEESDERTMWAAAQGFTEQPGTAVLSFKVRSLQVNADQPSEIEDSDEEGATEGASQADAQGYANSAAFMTPASPAGQVQDEGFEPGEATVAPEPAELPHGLREHLAGTVRTDGGPEVDVRSWTDGRAWVKVRATDQWMAPRLFDMDQAVRVVELEGGGQGYLSADGRKVAVHSDGLDLTVTGTLASDQLVDLAASLDVDGRATPEDWSEFGTTTLSDAGAAQPELLVPHGLDGFASPAVRAAGDVVTQVYAGPGDRGFVLTQTAGSELPPPSDGDTIPLQVRAADGRYSAARGELEWTENGSSFSLSSPVLSANELVDIARGLGEQATGGHVGSGSGSGSSSGNAQHRTGDPDEDEASAGRPTPADGSTAPSVLLAWTPTVLDDRLAAAASVIPGVRAVSVVRSATTDMAASRDSEGRIVQQLDAGWAIPLDTIAVDPAMHAQFASLADQTKVTALADNEALLSRTSAMLRGIAPGGVIELVGGARLVVADVVEDATLGAAELAVTAATGEAIGVVSPRYMLVSHEGDSSAVENALRSALEPGAPIRFRTPGDTPFLRQGDAVLPPLRLKQRFGEFAYQPPAEGEDTFVQDQGWQDEYLVERNLPIIGPMTCHRAVIDALEGALREIEAANLSRLVDPNNTGCH
ncbi:MAG TPA: zf-HC2 domain-containing protein, partial [Acidimicrobiales bacterium]